MQELLYDVVGLGNAMVDVLARVSDRFLTDRDLTKGNMTLVDAPEAGKIYQDLDPERQVSGGSAANTVAGLASLGGTPAFIGKIHDDELGKIFKRDIGAAGVDFFTDPLTEGPSTGRSIVLITPDAERSMFTYLGASSHISKKDVDENIIKASKVLYLEGYLWDEKYAKQAMLKACYYARKHNKKIALSLSDTKCVERHRRQFMPLIKRYVDILFANEDEIKTLYEQTDLYHTLDMVKHDVEIAAITRDEHGSIVVNGRIKTFVEAEKVSYVVDSTGAGDLYAAGFLYGYTTNRTLGTCALIGGIAASEIISHYGARPEVSLRGFVRKKLQQYGKTI